MYYPIYVHSDRLLSGSADAEHHSLMACAKSQSHPLCVEVGRFW